MKERTKQISIIAITSLLSVGALSYFAAARQPVVAQSSVATMIGGKTEGYQDACCTGMILGFESVDSKQPLILDGDAMYQPGLSASFSYYLESTSDSCTLGSLSFDGTVPAQAYCLDPGEECYSGSFYPLILTVGTSSVGCEYVNPATSAATGAATESI